MTDTILGNEISEFVANRQYAKIQYLQEENKQLQEQLRDLEKALKLNKEVLRLTLDSNPNNSNNSTNSSESIQSKQLLMKLHEENEMLRNQITKLTEERNLAQNKVLLQQQISEENQAFYKDMIAELEEKLGELRRCIQDKEYTIQDIEKNRGLNDNGQMIKIREIVTPNEQSLRLHEELESTRQILNKLSQESQNLQEQNTKLKLDDQVLKRELIKVRIILRSPLAYYKMRDFLYNDDAGNSDDNIGIHNEIYMNPGYNGDDQQQHPNTLNNFGYQPPQNNPKYLTNNERAIYQEKIQKTEALLKGFKELFEKEKNKTSLLIQQTEEMEKKIENSFYSNEQLIKGIKLRDQRIQQLQSEVQYYRSQYGNYLHLMKTKRKINLNLSFQMRDQPFQQNQYQTQQFQPPPQKVENNQKILSESDEDPDDAEQHISILEGQEIFDDQSPDIKRMEEIDEPQKQFKRQSTYQGNQYSMNYQECRQFLLNTAKDLYLHYNLKMNNLQKKQLMDPQKWGKARPIWHVKSISDPLDYFTLNFQNLQIQEKNGVKVNSDYKKLFPKNKQHNKNNTKDPNSGWDKILNDISMIQHEKPNQQKQQQNQENSILKDV